MKRVRLTEDVKMTQVFGDPYDMDIDADEVTTFYAYEPYEVLLEFSDKGGYSGKAYVIFNGAESVTVSEVLVEEVVE